MKEIPELKIAGLINDLKYSEAEKEIKEILSVQPDNIRMKINLGKLYMMDFRFEESLSIFRHLNNVLKDMPSIYIYLGQLYSETGKNKEAEENFLKAIELQNKNPYYLKLLERHYLKSDDELKAIELYEERLNNNPEELNSLLSLGLLLQLSNDERAEDVLKTAVELDSIYIRPLLYLGGFYACRRDYTAAIECFSKIINVDINEQLRVEIKNKEISLFPCLDNLFQSALVSCSEFRILNKVMKECTRRQDRIINDPRIFHDVNSIDSPYIEYGHEDALNFYFDYMEFRNIDIIRDNFVNRLFEGNNREIDLSSLSRKKEYDKIFSIYKEKKISGEISFSLLAVVAVAAYDSGNETVLDEIEEYPAQDRENDILKYFVNLTLCEEYKRKNMKEKLRVIVNDIETELKIMEREKPEYRIFIKLLLSWCSMLVMKLKKSNRLYIEYLEMDEELEVSRQIYYHTGWFIMK